MPPRKRPIRERTADLKAELRAAQGGMAAAEGRARPDPKEVEEQRGRRVTPPRPPPPAPPPPPDPVPEPPPAAPDFAGDDILQQQYDRFMETFGPLADAQLQAADERAGVLSGLAGDYAGEVRGSRGYEALGGYADEMRALYEQGGLTDVTRANLEASRRAADQQVRAQRELMMQDLAERGTTGGGAEIASLMGDRAAAADRMSARDLETNAMAQEQALAALERSQGAEGQLFDIDQGLAGTQLDYNTEGSEGFFDINQMLTDSAMNAWKDIERGGRQLQYDLTRQGVGDVFRSSKDVADRLSGESSATRDNARGVIGETTDDLNATGSAWTGFAGGYTPKNIVMPPIPQFGGGAAAGGAGEAAIKTGLQAITSGASNASGGGQSGGGGTSGGGGGGNANTGDIFDEDEVFGS